MNFVLRHVGTLGWNRVLVILVFMWLAILLFTILPMLTTHVAPPTDTRTMEKLARAVSDLEALRKQNLELQQILQGINLS